MSRRFGESCSSAEILMVQSLAYIRCIYAYDLEERHMQVARKVAKISRMLGRPQGVPTFREYLALAEFFDRHFEAPNRNFGAHLVPTRASKAMFDQIVAHERGALSRRIAGDCAA
jgi:hypothetical protein